MTEDKILEYLWVLINTGVVSTEPEVVTVDEHGEGELRIDAGEYRFAITVRRVGPALSKPRMASDDDTTRATYAARRSELERMIEEGHDDAELNGCVPPEDVGRMLDEAMARGLAERERQQRNIEGAQAGRRAG